MPNWISNTVHLEGNKKDIKTFFKKHFKRGNFDYDTIIPQPRLKKDCPAEYICNPEEKHIEADKKRPWFNWFNWNCDNWGTKWNAYDTFIDDRDTYFWFESPWDCPIPVFEKLSRLYPNISFIVSVDGELDRPFSFVAKNGELK